MFDIKGKVVVITGGGGVLCGTMAKALAQVGARIAVWDLIEEAAARIDRITSDCALCFTESVDGQQTRFIANDRIVKVGFDLGGGLRPSPESNFVN